MDMKSKSTRWVESIYQTFEAVCEDVDSTMSQAPMKYVGNPVHTVGKGVKKFCSSVMQDLLPPVNSGKIDVPEASREESDYIEGYIDSMEENEFYINGEQPVEVHGADSGVNQGTVNNVQSSSPDERQESAVNETDAFCNIFDSGMHAVATPDALPQMNVSYNSAITGLTSSLMVEKPHSDPFHEYEHIETQCVGPDRSSPFKSTDGEFTLSTNNSEDALSNNTKPPSATVLGNTTNVIVSKPVGKFEQNESLQRANSSKCFTFSYKSNDADPFRVSESETLSCSSGSLFEQGWDSSTLESSVTFSDICISDDFSDSDPLAEGFSVDDVKLTQPDMLMIRHPLFPSSHRRSLKSYKKLLQDTLNSKRRLVKEYKQLGIWHGDIYDEHNSTESSTSTKSVSQSATLSSSSKDATTHGQNLSEWELL